MSDFTPQSQQETQPIQPHPLPAGPEPPQSNLSELFGTAKQRRFFWTALTLILMITFGLGLYLTIWGRIRYSVPHWFVWGVAIIAIAPSVLGTAFVRRLLQRWERQQPSAVQLKATCDKENQHVSDKVVRRVKYLLTVDAEQPSLNEDNIHLIQREHWQKLFSVLWLQVVIFVGLVTAFGLFDGLTPYHVWWQLWLLPLAAAAWGFVRGMTEWYFTVYFETSLRLVRAKCPPLPFIHDVDDIRLTSITTARREDSKLSLINDSVTVLLVGIGEAKDEETSRWSRLPYIQWAEDFTMMTNKLIDRLRAGT